MTFNNNSMFIRSVSHLCGQPYQGMTSLPTPTCLQLQILNRKQINNLLKTKSKAVISPIFVQFQSINSLLCVYCFHIIYFSPLINTHFSFKVITACVSFRGVPPHLFLEPWDLFLTVVGDESQCVGGINKERVSILRLCDCYRIMQAKFSMNAVTEWPHLWKMSQEFCVGSAIKIQDKMHKKS